MKKLTLCVLLVTLGATACQPGAGIPTPTGEEEQVSPTSTLAPEERLPELGVIYQWASSAQASSEFADPEWSASQAVGGPDAPGCGDYQFAWASAASDGIETLELFYETPVYPLLINVHQSFNPDQVVKIEVYDPESEVYYTVLQKNPRQVDRPCPYQLSAAVEGLEFPTNRVRLTVDQSQLGLGWNEIDAVELVGALRLPEDEN